MVEFVPNPGTPNVGRLRPNYVPVERVQIEENDSVLHSTIKELSMLNHNCLVNVKYVEESYVYFEKPRHMINFSAWDPNNSRRLILTHDCNWQGKLIGQHSFLNERFRKIIKDLIVLLKHLHTRKVCTKMDWKEDDVKMINDDPKLMVPLGRINGKIEDADISEDYRRLAKWITSVTGGNNTIDLEHFIKSLSGAAGTEYFLGVFERHPVLMSHKERGDFLFSFSRDMEQLVKFQGWVTYNTVLGRLNSKLFDDWRQLVSSDSPLYDEKIKRMNKDNRALLQFMCNVRAHLITKSFGENKDVETLIFVDEIDKWLSSTFPGLILLAFEALFIVDALQLFIDV